MKTSQIKVFLAVVRNGTIAAAARQLNRSRTTVSTGWADLPLPLIAKALHNQQLTTVRHRSAKWWKAFSTLETEQAQGGAVVGWLAGELEHYLAGAHQD